MKRAPRVIALQPEGATGSAAHLRMAACSSLRRPAGSSA
ncbi:hypothetical protein F750_6458 [Streptomyces sp. PAMC 26508]|nr:hypothetical protein F750_6458 [Streptomyces sp. PAMC 26508]